MFETGVFTGWQSISRERRVSRGSLLRWAHANRCTLPKIGMYPYSVVTLDVDAVVSDAVSRAAGKVDAVVSKAESMTEFGILIAKGESCCGVVDCSIGMNNCRELARAARRWENTESMLLIAISGDDQPPFGLIESGFDKVCRRPFNPRAVVSMLTKSAREYQEAAKAKYGDRS